MKKDRMFTYHILQDRERKNLAILELIRKKGPVSKADISRALGYNIVTITNYIDYYVNKRMILEVGLDVSSGGRRPELLELNARSGYVVGVDVGPEYITVVVTDLKINCVAKSRAARPAGAMEDMCEPIIKIIEETIKKSRVDSASIKNIGLGVSGIVDYPSGTIHDTDPTRGRTRVSFIRFASAIEQKFNIPVYVGNDASCAVFGEKTLSPGADVDNLLYVYSDVGCGIIIHGDVYIGSSGCAGETQLAFNGLQKDEKSAVKEYTYLRPWGVDLGIAYEARRAVEKGVATEILTFAKGDKEQITKDMIIDAARKNDRVALELIENAGRNLGIRIAYMVNLFNPALVIIGGGMEKAGDFLMDPVKLAVRKYAFEEPAAAVKIIPSFLGEDSIVLGTAALAAREVFIQM
jgi:predicted NBD/HSP70 family sugar kinase